MKTLKKRTWENGIGRKLTLIHFPEDDGYSLQVERSSWGKGDPIGVWLPKALAKSIGTALLRKPTKKRRGAK